MNIHEITAADVREALKQPSNILSAEIIMVLRDALIKQQAEINDLRIELANVRMSVATNMNDGR